MDKTNQHNNIPHLCNLKSPKNEIASQNTITIYTIMAILNLMKNELGLEAMLEYISQYINVVDKNNPNLRSAVRKALSMMSVEKIYKDAMGCE